MICLLWFFVEFGLKSPDLSLDLSEHEIYSAPPVAVANNGTIVVVHADEGQLLFFSPTGKFTHKVGTRGQGPGELQQPGQILWDSKEKLLRVLDYSNRRFSQWTAEGKWIKDIPFPSGFVFDTRFLTSRYLLMKKDPAGHFEGKPSLVKHDFQTGKRLTIREYPLGRKKQVTEAALPGGGQIALLLKWEPKLLAGIGSDFIAVSWPEDREIHIIDFQGKSLNSFKAAMPRFPVTDDDVEKQLLEVDPKDRPVVKGKLVRLEYWPTFGEIFVDGRDRIWLMGPSRWDGDPCDFKCYDRSGRLLASGKLDGFPEAVSNDAFYVILEEEETLKLTRIPFSL